MFRNKKVRRQRAEFYASIIRRDSLCFDIGANIGDRTTLFSDLGARVVAVEPNPACITQLEQIRGPQRDVTIIEAAVSDVVGTAELLVNRKFSEMSTISDKFRSTVIELGLATEEDYETSAVTVNTVTLDFLIEEYGCPEFCKIDVEGSELSCLIGLSSAVQHLCFEQFSPEISQLNSAISRLTAIGNYQFNYVDKEEVGFESEHWLSAEEMIQIYEARKSLPGIFGWDIHAKLLS